MDGVSKVPELSAEDVLAEIGHAVSDSLPSVLAEEVLEAIREGVRRAFWQMIRNGTGGPCAGFYESVKAGVKEAVLELRAGERD